MSLREVKVSNESESITCSRLENLNGIPFTHKIIPFLPLRLNGFKKKLTILKKKN